MRFTWETPPTRIHRPTTFIFRGLERKSGKVRVGMISAATKNAARRALKRDGLRQVRLESA